MWVLQAIREDPSPAAKVDFTPDKKYKKAVKLTYDERKAAVAAKKAQMAAADADDSEEEAEAADDDEDDE
jgi:large subunit ribosomal protein L5e